MQEKNRESNQKNAQKEPNEQKNQKNDRKYDGGQPIRKRPGVSGPLSVSKKFFRHAEQAFRTL